MGKSFELLGLAAFNVMIAIILSTTFLSNGGAGVTSLNETNVKAFVNEVAEVAGGLREDMDDYSITRYFMRHIKDDGAFFSRIDYTIPDFPETSRDLEMDKNTFISHVLQGMKDFDKHETAVYIENVEINDNGTEAVVITTNYERGVIPIQDGFGDARMLPVTGTSYCEQELILSNDKIIQMAEAKCDTSIAFADAY